MSYLHYKGGDGEEIDVQNKRGSLINYSGNILTTHEFMLNPIDYYYTYGLYFICLEKGNNSEASMIVSLINFFFIVDKNLLLLSILFFFF